MSVTKIPTGEGIAKQSVRKGLIVVRGSSRNAKFFEPLPKGLYAREVQRARREKAITISKRS